MDIRRKELDDVYFPFSELMTGDHFVLHSQHLKNATESPVFLKTGADSYQSADDGDSYTLTGEYEVHRTWVSLAPSCYMF